MATMWPSLDYVSHGSFTNRKLTADKLVKEQASVKPDFELTHTKLRKATEQIHVLETKLQEAVNEIANLKVKQVEDAKLWNGLDKKISSTKALCDQLSEAVNKLADRSDTADEDRKLIKENAKAFDKLKLQFDDLSTKLQCADNKIKFGKQEICKLIQEEEAQNRLKDELCIAGEVIKGKGSTIKELEEAVEQSKENLHTLDSQLHAVQHELISKEEILKNLSSTKDDLERENNMLQCNNLGLKQQIANSCLEIKNLEETIRNLVSKISQLDKDSSAISNNVVMMFSSFKKYHELIHQEKDLTSKRNQRKLDKLQQQLVYAMEKNNSFNLLNDQLTNRIIEMQKAQEFVMVQHAGECHLAEDKACMLESEVVGLLSKKNELEKLASELEDKDKHLSEISNVAENKMQELSQIISKLELENHNTQCRMQLQLQEKVEQTEALHNEIIKHEKHADSLGNQISELRAALDEKEKLIISCKEREKQQEGQQSKVVAALATAECNLTEAKKQYDMMFDGKQVELSKHLKETSQKNVKAMNVIRKKYEAEKEAIATEEKEKANKFIKEMERNCEEKITKNREEAERSLMHVKEQKTMNSKIQDCARKEKYLLAHHREEVRRLQLHAKNEMREKTSSLQKEHEIQMKSLKMQYVDVQKKLQVDLEMQKSKYLHEEKKRKLLQLQWKETSENQQDNQEADSKKEYSASSIKMRKTYRVKGHEVSMPTPESERKVTRHEYEVETSNGKTIMKRRKTKSTVMFGDPSSHKTMHGRTPNSNKDITQMTR